MVFVKKALPAAILGLSILAAGCGGGGGSSTPVAPPDMLSGTAAAGAAIIGQVTVKGSAGNTTSTLIEANGNYNVDVSGLTAPYILRAEGTVGGKAYTLHSYAEEADIGATVNITPFTDLIVSNAAGQIASAFYDSGNFTNLTAEEIDAQETALQDKLADVFTSLGVDSAIDLLNSSFSADHTGLDAALDMISVEVDTTTNIATITNLIDNTTVTDDVTDAADNSATLTVTSDLAAVQTDYEAMADRAAALSALFATGLPTTTQLDPFFSEDFLDWDIGKALFLTEISTDPSLVGLTFGNISYDEYDENAGTATIVFNVTINGVTDPEPEKWYMAKSAGGVWEFRGNQEVADVWFGFICHNNTEFNVKGCGVNVGVEDNDFFNTPGSEGVSTPIASARMTVVRDGAAVPGAVIYLGEPQGGTAGQLRIYDTDYSDDYMDFGTGQWDNIDPSLFQGGDVVQIELFTAPLDISNATSPQVTGTAVQVITRYVVAAPISNGDAASYPSVSSATVDALAAYTNGNLDVSWTVPSGLNIDEIWFNASQGNTWLNVDDENLSGSSATTTISLDTSSMDTGAQDFYKELRVYARNSNGQDFLTTYNSVGVTTGGGGGGGGSSLTCNTESGWDDLADGGAGRPISPHSFADFEAVVVDCGTAIQFTASDLEGVSFSEGQTEVITFNAGGAGVYSDFDGDIAFTWTVETATAGHNYVVVEGSVDTLSFRETRAIIGLSGAPGTGTVYTFRAYSEQTNYSAENPMVRGTGTDGEIWGGTMTQQ